ncbi:MAG: TRAP transporter substrate-binding protein DctP [Bacillota bacterium]|nr:TRAP transporter substrate-binding protein DctP [Bacillota bacterium]
MKLKKGLAIILALTLVLTCFAACGGGGDDPGTEEGSEGEAAAYSADSPLVLRLASDAPIEHIASTVNNELVELIAEKTEGRVQLDYYPASQLGSYETVYEEVMLGAIDAAQITVPDASDARLGAAYLPWYATSFEEAYELYGQDSLMTATMREICAAQNVNFVGFLLEGFIGWGFVDMPQDLYTPGTNKSLALRSPAMLTFRIPAEELGFTATTVTYAEVPTAMQTGVIDGWVGGTPNMNYAWVGEIINYMVVNYMHAEATAYVVSEVSLGKLTEEDRALVLEAFTEMSDRSFTMAEENEKDYMQRLQDDYGVEVIEFTEEQVAEFAQFTRENVWPQLEELLTVELMDAFRAEIGM